MCGIVGYLGKHEAKPILFEGLRRLEYRGYDSAGLCIISPDKELGCIHSVGNLDSLERALERVDLPGKVGVGHTRWATHGAPTMLSLIHISEPTRLGMISYAVFCLKKKKN